MDCKIATASLVESRCDKPDGSRGASHRVVAISPFRCKMWERHDRIESHISEESCKSEIESFSRHGQLVPVMGRPLTGDPDHDVELIFGARRLFVARHLKQPLLVEIVDMMDREAIAAMDIENRHRQDVSPYERGRSYSRWLQAGVFESQEDIARSLKVSCSYVSRLVKLARLPSVIVDAFGTPLVIRETWGLELMDALESPERKAHILHKARAATKATPRPNPEALLRSLLAQTARPVRQRAHDEVVKGADNRPLFRIRYLERSVAFVVSSGSISRSTTAAIRSAMLSALEPKPEGCLEAVENHPSDQPATGSEG